jgi:membrane protease YdiL (CAAX protease family)
MADIDDADLPPLPPVEFAPLTAPPAATQRVWTVFVGYAGALVASALLGYLAVGGIALIAALRQRLAQGAWMSPPMAFAFAHRLAGQPVGVLATALATALALAAFALIPASLSAELLIDRLRLRARPKWFAWGVLAAWGLRGIADLTGGLAQLFHVAPRASLRAMQQVGDPARPGLTILAVLILGLAVAAGEELFFRGYAWSRLDKRWGPWVASAVSAALFATAHAGDPTQAAFSLAAGVFLGWVSARAGTIRVTLVAHALHNVVAVLTLASATALRSRAMTGLWMVLGVVALAVSVTLLRRLDPDDAA